MEFEDRVEMYGKMVLALEIIENSRDFAFLIPEVRTNLVFASPNAASPKDVLAVEGRITVVDGFPRAAGPIRFGASNHMARLIIEINKRDSSVRAGINFAGTPELTEWLKGFCEGKGWTFGVIDRSKEPVELSLIDGESMPWKVDELVRSSGGKVPKVFYETGAVGKEPVSVLVGKDPVEVAREACEIASAFSRETRGMIRKGAKVGKIAPEEFESIIVGRFGAVDNTVIIPPKAGVDAGVIDLGNNLVLVVAEDPIFSIPSLPLEMFGWYTVHIGASDVAVMGVKPRYMCYTLLVPPGTGKSDLEIIVDSIHRAAIELDIAIVGGHTGYYPGITTPLIGGITVFGIAAKGEYVTAAGAKPGNDIILTKGPAIEAVGILASVYEKELVRSYDVDTIEKAKSLMRKISVVKDAMIAMNTSGVTAMHDATEGGVIGGLFEIAQASNVGMEVDESQFIIPDEVELICKAFNIDPIEAISEGSLIITAAAEKSSQIIGNLKRSGIEASVIGKVVASTEKRILRRRNGEMVPLRIPEQDPFWPVFFEGLPSTPS
ncbi:MAG: thiamine-phosphate synthase family protein [Methanomassiliicoccales archaeon]|jgi:hydrogenase maturation factor/predicted fused transcriptional regulator/phosphomethylpyrimidine kinase|nr:thiamine-phosphate synthase family protein [Methanomassiliicoccales archaeon]